MDDLISVIIPLYDAEAYIGECLHSIMGQTYSNLEIIVIDDGSMDNSRKICNDISKKDQRICVLHQEHQGVSAARNRGIEAAKGKYLFFLDGDDFIHLKLLEILYRVAEITQASIAAEYYCWKSENLYDVTEMLGDQVICPDRVPGSVAQKHEAGELAFKYIYLDSQEILQELPAYGKQGGIGGKMIRRTAMQFFKFDTNLIAGEDTKFLYQLVIDGADAAILHKAWYYYRKDKKDNNKKYKVQVCQSIYECIRYICDSEKNCGRMQNAVHIEAYLIRCMIEWNKGNWKIEDKNMSRYLKELGHIERKRDLFSRVNWHIKKNFYLTFYFYPFNWFNCRISNRINLWRIMCRKIVDRKCP